MVTGASRILSCGTVSLIAIALAFSSTAAAISDKEYAKCQTMLQKQSKWLIDRANNADRAHASKKTALVDRHVAGRPDAAAEKRRITRIVDRLVTDYDQEEYRKVLIDDATEELLTVENGDGFECWEQARVRRSFLNNLRRYERSFDELEEAIQERLGLETLRPDEGLVAILFYARGYAEMVIIDRLGSLGGGITFGPVSGGDYFRVVKAKAGTYRWHSVTNKLWNGRETAFFKQSELDFKVEAGKLNYVGAFLYKTEGYGRYRINVFDRLSLLLSMLENRYPELLNSHEIHNGLNAENRFMNFYLREQAKWKSGDDDA